MFVYSMEAHYENVAFITETKYSQGKLNTIL